ncbi:MAG: hypothetical protein JRG91_07895 [Deltaproteobacteria bacterium]|nr:hypothetical protein [Deltaproteobacteria bacterium]
MACPPRFGFWIVPILAVVLASCGGKEGNGDEDGEVDGIDDVADGQDVEDDDDVVDETVDDVAVDAVEDVVDEEVVDPCTSPGLHTGTAVLVADPGGEIGADTGGGARLAYGGGVIGLGWSDGREEELGVTNEEVYFQILDPDGTLVGTEVQVSDAALESRPPAVVWAGDRFVSVWGDSRAMPAGNLFLGGVDAAGSLAGAEAQVTTDGVNAMLGGAAWSGSRIGAAWTDNKDSTMDIYFALVGTDGSIDGSITRVQDAAGNSFNASVVWSGSSYYLVWADTAGGAIWEFRIYLAILDASGSVTSGPTMISPSDSDAKMPVAAWSDGVLAVCWEDFRDSGHELYCAGYDASGTETVASAPVSSTAGNVPSAILSPSLVSLASGFGLAWADENGVPGDDEVYFAQLSTSLEVDLGDTPLTVSDGEITAVSLVWTGAGYGVAWVVDDDTTVGEDTLHYMPFLYCE